MAVLSRQNFHGVSMRETKPGTVASIVLSLISISALSVCFCMCRELFRTKLIIAQLVEFRMFEIGLNYHSFAGVRSPISFNARAFYSRTCSNPPHLYRLYRLRSRHCNFIKWLRDSLIEGDVFQSHSVVPGLLHDNESKNFKSQYGPNTYR
jgi:hypothetical protein